MVRMTWRSLSMVALLWGVMGIGAAAVRAEKPQKIPVALGKWTGQHAVEFKSALRSSISKECVVVRAAKARVIIEAMAAGRAATPRGDGQRQAAGAVGLLVR